MVKNPPTGDTGLIPALGRYPVEENGNAPQYSCLRNPTDRRNQWAAVHRVDKRVRHELANE